MYFFKIFILFLAHWENGLGPNLAYPAAPVGRSSVVEEGGCGYVSSSWGRRVSQRGRGGRVFDRALKDDGVHVRVHQLVLKGKMGEGSVSRFRERK